MSFGSISLQNMRAQTHDAESLIESLGDLPAWVKPKIVMGMAQQYAREQTPSRLPGRLTFGSAIPSLMLAVLLLWGFFVVFGAMSYLTSECHDHAYASRPVWLWLMFGFIVWPALLAISVKSMRLTIVPKYQVLRELKILGCPVPFWAWFLWQVILSTVAWIGHASTSAFTATMVQTGNCHAIGKEFLNTWNEMWASYPVVPPWDVALCLLWLAKLILPLSSIVQALPYGWGGDRQIDTTSSKTGFREIFYVDYELAGRLRRIDRNTPQHQQHEIEMVDDIREYDTHYTCEYNTLIHRDVKQNHGSAAGMLARAAGITLVYFADVDYASTKANEEFDKYDNVANTAHYDNANELRQKALNEAESHMKSQLSRSLQASLIGLFVGALQFQLQVTSLSMFCHVCVHVKIIHKKPQDQSSYWELVLCVIATTISSFVDLHQCWSSLRKIRDMLCKYEERAMEALNKYHRRQFYLIVLMVFLSTTSAVYAVVKGMLGQLWCHGDGSYTWNLTGCVKFGLDRRSYS